ncbi:MAG: hypothetical protein ACREUU_19030, partial [Gammaproteobacteria bacterium]
MDKLRLNRIIGQRYIFICLVLFGLFLKGEVFAQGTWSTQTSGTANNLFSVHFVSAILGWAVGGNNTFLHTANG